MPSTENATLQRIQQEIKESVQREEELRKQYNGKHPITNGHPKPDLQRAQSTSTLASDTSTNGSRRFAPNPTAKGVMHRFIKSRGKVAPQQLTTSKFWAYIEPLTVTAELSKRTRNNFVPIQERIQQELQEYSVRERELRNERRKSQPDLMALLEESVSPEPKELKLKRGRSTSELFAECELEETVSAPPSLKPARSLAELCEVPHEKLETPGTHSLILQFENLKGKREQNRA